MPTRRKNDPLDFVALMEAADAQPPAFDLLPAQPRARAARRARPVAKTLLPEDHHYKVCGVCGGVVVRGQADVAGKVV